MPEMTFTVRWPDGTLEHCYSPSLVMHDHLTPGTDYPLAEFVAKSVEGLTEAGDRVRARYGMGCAGALGQIDDIRARATGFGADSTVRVLAMVPPLPSKSEPARSAAQGGAEGSGRAVDGFSRATARSTGVSPQVHS